MCFSLYQAVNISDELNPDTETIGVKFISYGKWLEL